MSTDEKGLRFQLAAAALAGVVSLVIHLAFLCIGTVVVVHILRAMEVIA